ncbi:telomerase-binding protein EST1A isoform X3 [Venturia canescens]|nr:telomerase-binding protein EST1A isoform X3 [Venturia canescens]
MRGAAPNRAPPRLIYTPGSGPLKKTGRAPDDFDREANSGERTKSVSVQDRLRPMHFNSTQQGETVRAQESNEKLNDATFSEDRSSIDDGNSVRTSHHGGDGRRRSKKPELPLYVPKKVQEALAKRDVTNRSPPPRTPTPPQSTHQQQANVHIAWERERVESGNRDWDNRSSRGFRNEGHRNRMGRQTVGDSSTNNVRNRPDDQGKRFSGNRRGGHRNTNENEEREWRSNSPMSARNYGSRRDYPREIRQGSEPLAATPNNANEYNRIRDTRSVDPPSFGEKFQRKPPSGRWVSDKMNILPPRLQRKYLAKNGLDVPPGNSLFSKSSEDWDGSTISFQGSSGYNNTSWTRNNMPPPHSSWSNTIPARSRGRGRLTTEELESSIVNHRPGTPDQYSAASSRSQTPSQEYSTRHYERRGSNSTMYTSMESLSRADTHVSMPQNLFVHPNTNRGRRPSPPQPPDIQTRRSVSPNSTSTIPHHQTHNQWHRTNNNAEEATNSIGGDPNDERYSLNPSPVKSSEPYSSLPDMASIANLDWSEDVETPLYNKNENDHEGGQHRNPSRSSSVTSLRDNGSISGHSVGPAASSNQFSGRDSGFRRKRKDRRRSGARDNRNRSCSRDNENHGKSRERTNNQQNREVTGNERMDGHGRRYEGNRKNRNGRMPRSRESSRDRDHRGAPRNVEENRRINDENWRTGKRVSTCEPEEPRSSLAISNSQQQFNTTGQFGSHANTNALRTTSSTLPKPSANHQPPGVLVLTERNLSSPRYTTNVNCGRQDNQSQQQRKTLFDPNNPDKPIIVRTTGNRNSSLQLRDKDTTCQASSPSLVTCNSHTLISPTGHQSFGPYRGPPMEAGNAGISGIRPSVPFVTEQMQGNNSRPAWYDPRSEVLRSAKDPYRLLEVETIDRELQWVLSSGSLTSNWEKITNLRLTLRNRLEILLESDIKFCQTENVEQHFWKILYYNMIEMLRKIMPKENNDLREQYKRIMLEIIDEGTQYFENLLTVLEKKYKFKLEVFLASTSPPNGLGFIGLALVSAQKIFLFLGDLARYKEQANETTNYGRSRQWYLKAQQINPKNGRPYNQLALLAHYARRKLDAVYYYMRSLMASNPFHSARESLIALFDENRKKYLHYYESTERKRKEEREWKERARMKEKEGANNAPGALRRETWIHPGGRRVRRTTSSTGLGDSKFSHSDSEELSQLTSVEVNKRFITSYLHVHGKLITKIGMETFQEAAIQMLREFRTLLQHSPLPIPETRLLQLLALNMFAIDTTQLKDSQMEQGYRSEVQERALVVSLQMFNLILERGVALLRSQFDENQQHRLIVDEDMQVLLPAIKIWCDWMLCHSTVWNPPPSCTDYRVGPPGDSWSRLATMVNLLEMLSYSRQIVIQAKDTLGRGNEVELIKLPEDTTLSGFTPLMSNPQDPCYADKAEDMEVAQMCLRIQKILFFGEVFLCGLETPVLKLQKNEYGLNEYVSVVEASSSGSPSSPPEQVTILKLNREKKTKFQMYFRHYSCSTHFCHPLNNQSDSELLVESYSEDESDEVPRVAKSSGESWPGGSQGSSVPAAEIRSLIERKEELERRQRKQERHRQRVQAILKKSTVSVEIEVRPRLLVPDTNCFIDYLPQLQAISRATSGTQPLYTLMIPLVVLNELEGLARGSDARDCPPVSRATLNPEHVTRVAESSKAALAFARSRNPAIKCLTTRGSLLTSSTFTVEEDVSQEGLTRNDDRILATCLSLCRSNSKDHGNNEDTEPRRLKREVVLLTEDRNLRVKALARDVPVREVPDFMQWAGLG